MANVFDDPATLDAGEILVVTVVVTELEIVIALRGEIDISSVAGLEDVLDMAVRRRPRRLVIDVAELDFLGVVGLRAIAIAIRDLRPFGGQVVLRRPAAVVRRLLDVAGIAERVVVEPATQVSRPVSHVT